MSTIILLNGAGSSGKTSIARGIQHLSETPWLTFGVDTFIDMTPPTLPNQDNEYFVFKASENDNGPLLSVESTPSSNKLFGTMADFAALLANQDNNLIIDEVLLNGQQLAKYIDALSDHLVYFIGVQCDLAILQEREHLRQDRAIGLSNGQFDIVHQGKEYDLTVDTSHTPVLSICQQILKFIKENTPKSFENMRLKE